MATRYINTSEKTLTMAQGLMLLAKLKNSLPGTQSFATATRDWNAWAQLHGRRYESFVLRQHEELFDRISHSDSF